VPNRVSGTQSFLDAVWAGAPFASHAAFMTRVQSVATTWRNSGLLSQTEQTSVVNAAQAAASDLQA
jgi:hypothetical protein